MQPEELPQTPPKHGAPQPGEEIRYEGGAKESLAHWQAPIEVTRREPDRVADLAGQVEHLHVCFHCSGELAYPLDWCEEGPRHWRIVLRCPECESTREGVFEQSVVERLDDELDRAAGALLADLRRVTHANMAKEVDFFVRALHAKVIVPSDF